MIGRSRQGQDGHSDRGWLPCKRGLLLSCLPFLLAGILLFPAAAQTQTQTPALVVSPSPLQVDEGG
ncbi:MAG: hypothetical protein OXI73_08650, partial [Rhodospirillales bacterium]|nr:hypothetical protein [Rhodospirillales bacterium]